MVFANAVPFALTAGLALLLEASIRHASKIGLVTTPVARKMLHVSMGPVFMLCWPMFQGNDAASAAAAAAIPAILTLKFLLIGFKFVKDVDTVKSMSRTGMPAFNFISTRFEANQCRRPKRALVRPSAGPLFFMYQFSFISWRFMLF
jgi:hypothetical protein